MTEHSPTVKRRQLSMALLDLRKARGLTAAEVTKRLDWTPSKLTRIERNDWKLPNPRDIRDLLDTYNVTDEDERAALIDLAKQARQRGWWADYKDVFRGRLPAFEAGAVALRTYDPNIPGLCQTPDYMRAVFRAGFGLDEATIERHVEARLARQEILERRNPPQLMTVIDEAALHRLIGGHEVRLAQLEHLIKMGERPNVTIQVLPFSAGAHPAMAGGFVILDFEDTASPSLVYTETPTDDLYREKPPDLHRYTVIFSTVQALALSTEESAQRMQSMVRDLQQR
ncbi:helix-turn-helix domain-containing protein [Streptosporangium sp. G12]